MWPSNGIPPQRSWAAGHRRLIAPLVIILVVLLLIITGVIEVGG